MLTPEVTEISREEYKRRKEYIRTSGTNKEIVRSQKPNPTVEDILGDAAINLISRQRAKEILSDEVRQQNTQEAA